MHPKPVPKNMDDYLVQLSKVFPIPRQPPRMNKKKLKEFLESPKAAGCTFLPFIKERDPMNHLFDTACFALYFLEAFPV